MAGAWLGAGGSPWASRQRDRLRTVAVGAIALALASCVALLWLEAASMAEVPVAEASEAVHTVLAATHYGTSWMVGTGALAAFACLAATGWSRGHRRITGGVCLLALGIYFYSRSVVSHAGAAGDASWAVAADWLHLALASLWVGEVLVAGLIVLRVPSGTGEPERCQRARYVQHLSTSATVALAGIVATGLFSAWRGLGTLDNASGNPYANVLLAKLVLVGLAALLGASNRFLVMPGLLAHLRSGGGTADRSERRFATILQIEATVLAGALGLAAILSSTAPPGAA
jgi:putative copper resistance protein D